MKPLIFKVIYLVVITIVVVSCRKSNFILEEDTNVSIKDYGQGTGTTTWTKDKVYILDGFVFVNDGDILTIEPGTVIKGKEGQGDDASALVVSRGAKIIAEGTKDEPIIFTFESDDLSGATSITQRGKWGGLIILGRAIINTSSGENVIEGIPHWEPRGVYGGVVDNDNSGVLKYVSIRHGGINIGQDNEINGLTLGGIGSGTTIQYIEVVANLDDGVEVFGGSVFLRNIAVAFCGDDAFDFDEGFHGFAQFLLAIQSKDMGDKLVENDGGTSPENGKPFSIPTIFNATFIGNGSTSEAMSFQDYGGGNLYNSVMVNKGSGITIEYKKDRESSYNQFLYGNIDMASNVLFNIADNDTSRVFKVADASNNEDVAKSVEVKNFFFNQLNRFEDTGIGGADSVFQITPNYPLVQGVHSHYPVDFFEKVPFIGAFGTKSLWIDDWTLLDSRGLLK